MPSPDLQNLWPELELWQPVGMHDPVYRVRVAGRTAYLRADDGSASMLRRLNTSTQIPAPTLLDERGGWLLLSELPGVPLHDRRWRSQQATACAIAADALKALDDAGIRHGDMCLPNILGDLDTGQLTGIVDWRYHSTYEREIDVASTIWSCGYNGYASDAPGKILEAIGWPETDAAEVARLCELWTSLAGPPDTPATIG